MLRSGLFLSTRSLLSMGMLMWATRLIAGFGAVGLAAHEVLRQIWVFSNQVGGVGCLRRWAAGRPAACCRVVPMVWAWGIASPPHLPTMPPSPLTYPPNNHTHPQFFTSMDIATQSLVAFHLGKGDRGAAAAVFRRTLALAVGAGLVIMCLLFAARTSLPGVFTRDAAVIQQVTLVSRAAWGCPWLTCSHGWAGAPRTRCCDALGPCCGV